MDRQRSRNYAFQHVDKITRSIIAEVKKRKCLYTDSGDKRSTSTAIIERHKAWEQVEKVVGLPALQCKKQWLKLRYRFLIHRRRKALAKRRYKKWALEDDLEFITPYLDLNPPCQERKHILPINYDDIGLENQHNQENIDTVELISDEEDDEHRVTITEEAIKSNASGDPSLRSDVAPNNTKEEPINSEAPKYTFHIEEIYRQSATTEEPLEKLITDNTDILSKELIKETLKPDDEMDITGHASDAGDTHAIGTRNTIKTCVKEMFNSDMTRLEPRAPASKYVEIHSSADDSSLDATGQPLRTLTSANEQSAHALRLDAMDLFYLSMARSTKTTPKNIQTEIRMAVCKALCDAEVTFLNSDEAAHI